MNLEIERKFLVNSDQFKKEAHNTSIIEQGFLNSHKDRTVRIRLMDDKGFITVKGRSSNDGLLRLEWEKEIDFKEAQILLELCEETPIQKKRYEIRSGAHIFEVDEFYGANEGLTVAELELSAKNEPYEPPVWLGREITGELKYYNSQLSQRPYKFWKS